MKIFIIIWSLLCFGVSHAQAQETFPFVAKVTAKSVHLRAGPNANFESLDQLENGDEFIVVDASFDWRKVKLPADAKAYVHAGFVKDLGQGVGQVTGNRLNIRAAALTNASIIGQSKKGDLIRIFEKKDDWLRIEPPDQSFGWILKDFIEFKSATIPPVRVVQLPTKSKKEDTTTSVLQVARVSVMGVVEDLGTNAVGADIRHFLQSDNTVYNLKGYRHVLDGFRHQRVKMEGLLKPDAKSGNPVVLVTKITLVL